MNHHTTTPDSELTELRAEMAALRRELDTLRASTPHQTGSVTTPQPAEPRIAGDRPRSRREVLRRWGTTAGAAVGAAAVGAVALPGRAAAAAVMNGDPIGAGEINVCTSTTELKLPTSSAGAVFSHVLAVQDGVWSTPRIPFAESVQDTGTSSGVGALVGSVVMHGGYFQTNHPFRGSSGLRARGESPNSYGVWAAGRRAALRLERLNLQIPPPQRADAHNEGEFQIDDNSDLWYCVVPGSPGTWLKLAGPTTSGQFHPITPARVYDSRYTVATDAGVGPMQAGTSRTISVAQAFAPDSVTPSISNVVPVGSTAVAYNLTVAATGPAGYLSVNPGGTPAITASSINWAAPGTVLANASVVKLDSTRQVKVFCFGSSTEAIIDVVGYYR